MPDQTINCRFCRGPRAIIAGKCSGCGMPRQNASDNSRQKQKVLRCPGCRATGRDVLEPGRYCCRHCLTVYEDDDFTFVDTRPDRNLEKQGRRR